MIKEIFFLGQIFLTLLFIPLKCSEEIEVTSQGVDGLTGKETIRTITKQDGFKTCFKYENRPPSALDDPKFMKEFRNLIRDEVQSLINALYSLIGRKKNKISENFYNYKITTQAWKEIAETNFDPKLLNLITCMRDIILKEILAPYKPYDPQTCDLGEEFYYEWNDNYIIPRNITSRLLWNIKCIETYIDTYYEWIFIPPLPKF